MSSRNLIRKRNKKAELAGQTFLYIMGIIIVGAIMVYGVRAMFKLSNEADTIKLIEFKQDLDKLIKNNMKSGANLNEQVEVPGGFSKICFAEIEKTKPVSCETTIDPIACEGWGSSKNNIFLLEGKSTKEFISVINYKGESAILVADPLDIKCYDLTGGRFKLQASGKGSKIEIRP